MGRPPQVSRWRRLGYTETEAYQRQAADEMPWLDTPHVPWEQRYFAPWPVLVAWDLLVLLAVIAAILGWLLWWALYGAGVLLVRLWPRTGAHRRRRGRRRW